MVKSGKDYFGKADRGRVLMGDKAHSIADNSEGAQSTNLKPDLVLAGADGTLQIAALSNRAFRVRFTPVQDASTMPSSSILLSNRTCPEILRTDSEGVVRLGLPFLTCEVDRTTARLRFLGDSGRVLLSEAEASRKLVPKRLGNDEVFGVVQAFESPANERLYGTGCFQDGFLNIRCLPRRLTQVNTQISLPFVLSSFGYGLLWHNTGMSELNPPSHMVAMTRSGEAAQPQTFNVTTTNGNAEVERVMVTFESRFDTETAGRFAFMLDIGQKMASRHYVEIDGTPYVDVSNLWLPPTTSFFAELPAGEHRVKVVANADDAPVVFFDRVQERTTWSSPVAEAIDYVVIGGPRADEIIGGLQQLTGQAPMMPRWAFGYIHCRERFHSSDEIIATTQEFRRRKLPVDVMVQDWQYWGRHGWNAMRFDETFYPDPAGLVRTMHGMNTHFMLSVWSKIAPDSDLGKDFAARGFYIPGTDWVDFFNPAAAAYYSKCQNEKLASLGIDAWWQDATEPENDDLAGRQTAAGHGERVRLTYPLQVSRTVYEGQRASYPDRRVMILTRSAFIGQQRYAAATWSGDIGHDWETLKRQIPAGLNMAAAGYPYWTVDAGGFFRPGDNQHADPGYQERFLRWFQYATFLPLQRVHGYQTDTEFWRYGEEVERIARQYLEFRYRLLPYIYSLAASVTRTGTPMLRPLVFDFPQDPMALDQGHSFMFGRALHVAPVLAAGAKVWPVYLPVTDGGWFDFWTGEHRSGGQTYSVRAPISQIPLHLRAGAILPIGPVVQSTMEASGERMELCIAPGRDGDFELYEDNGADYEYENGAFSLIRIHWDDARHELSLVEREGDFEGILKSRTFRVSLVKLGHGPLNPDGYSDVVYTGAPERIWLK